MAGKQDTAAIAFAAAETGVRQLLANGKSKAALEKAKEVHKAHATAASEALLVDAYVARIESLGQQNLAYEAESLAEVVRSRFPSAAARLDALTAPPDHLRELLAPLNDPDLPAERRSAIESAVQRDVWDLAELSGCRALAEEHPLRRAAAVLLQAFVAVTTGPVKDEELELPDVSRRSPLAPWKLLVRAIAYFYRQQDDQVRECLAAIPPESAAARLVPAIHAMLAGETSAPLAPAARHLVEATTASSESLRAALEKLDQAFNSSAPAKQILKAIEPAIRECKQHAPGPLDLLKQHISVYCAMADVNKTKVMGAMGGRSRQDAHFLRLMARGMELTHDAENLPVACGVWEDFRQQAVQEGWFSPNGAEAATLYLHMADLLRQVPEGLMERLHQSFHGKFGPGEELPYFIVPEQLYERACALDPHFEAFSQWMEWARNRKGQGEPVAKAWHKIRPADIEPILYLMHDAANRNAFPTALQFLAKAERIDAVHSEVRRARLQLLAGSAVKHIQQKKLHLAQERIAEIAALPQAQQGDRPAFLAALRYLASRAANDLEGAAAHRAETERLFGGRVPGYLLMVGVASAAKRGIYEQAYQPGKLNKEERTGLPAAIARIVTLAADINAIQLNIPFSYLDDAARQLPKVGKALDTAQVATLAKVGVSSGNRDLAYHATAAGLERGGSTEARFLMLRAKVMAGVNNDRALVCAAAATELARRQREMQVVEEAVEWIRGKWGPVPLTLSLEQAGEVLHMEKGAKTLSKRPGQGPNYSHLLPSNVCQCPTCRQRRGEQFGPYGDFTDEFGGGEDEFDEDFDDELEALFEEFKPPPGMPPEIARMLFEEIKRAAVKGESFEEVMERLMGAPPRRKSKKDRRK